MKKYPSLRLAHNIGDINHSNYNTKLEILECKDPIGFDGIYRNVYENRHLLKGKSGILFVMGDYIGKDNEFDLPHVPKLEQYCNWDEILEISHEFDFELGWHTYSHPDLTKVSDEQLVREITPPFKMKYFAYPYGIYDQRVVEVVKSLGYEMAWSVTQGSLNPYESDYQYKIYRSYI